MTIKELNFLTQLLTYKPRYVVARILIIALIGIICMVTTVWVADDDFRVQFPYMSLSILFVLITELNVLFHHYINWCRFDVLRQFQFSVHLVFNLILCLFFFFFLLPVLEEHDVANNPFVQLVGIFTSFFILFLVMTITLLQLLQNQIKSQTEIERLQNAKTEMEYQSLVAQVNPHFLFNNLSVLKSLIKYDPEKALDFTQNFTDIYRYILLSKDRTTVTLAEELEFIQSYIALHKDRIGDGLQVTYDIPEQVKEKHILPLGIQILVENALKHNIASKSAPLHITIRANDAMLTVVNNLNPKDVGFSSKQGLNNVIKRYRLLTDRPVSVTKAEREFIVELPLI